MKDLRKVKLICSALLIAGLSQLFAQSWNDAEYAGYRCGLLDIRDVKVLAEGVEFTADLANTGRLPLEMPGKRPWNQVIVFTADASLASSGLSAQKDLIAAAVLRSGLKIKPGQMIRGRRFRSAKPSQMIPALEKPRKKEEESGRRLEKSTPEIQEGCPDLVIDSLWIIREGKYRIDFGWMISNQGTASAQLWQKDGASAGMGAFLGSSERITKASMAVGFFSLSKSQVSKKGLLAPGASMTGKGVVRLDYRRLPSQRVLQVRLDPNRVVTECLETNNESTVPLPLLDQ